MSDAVEAAVEVVVKIARIQQEAQELLELMGVQTRDDPVLCPNCDAPVLRIVRAHTKVEWSYNSETGEYDCGAFDEGGRFRVYCEKSGREPCFMDFADGLHIELQDIVFTGQAPQ